MDVFTTILETFSAANVTRIKTSLVDMRYAHIPGRFGNLGIRLNLPVIKSIEAFYAAMNRKCTQHGARLDACCSPAPLVGIDTNGCIDGSLINRLLEDAQSSRRVTTAYHNDIGQQRPLCKCTYSRDIGYSSGFQTCFKNHGACLYCFSQKNTKGAAIETAHKLMSSSGKKQAVPDSCCRCD
jgi:hypothetical protein